MNVRGLKSKITRAFRRYAGAPSGRSFQAIPRALTSGKLYEAYTLGLLAGKLTLNEGLDLRLAAGSYLRMRSSPGPIDRNFPRIDVYRQGAKIAEIWTDIEFLTLSYIRRGNPSSLTKGDYHELDIVMVDPNIRGNPSHQQIWLAVECKNTGYTKSLLKEILGVRRELSLLSHNVTTRFVNWPCSTVPADPPSCLLVYATDAAVKEYSAPGETFGILFYHEPI
jgi:hypothetical protein